MTMMRWDPFRDMTSLRSAMDRLFDESFIHPSRLWRGQEPAEPPLDIYQTDKAVVVKATVPGMKPEDVDVTITGDILTIKGEHSEEQETKEEHYFRKEIQRGSFSRSLLIPAAVKADKAEAVFENGVLTLTLPKAEEAKPKQIKVKPKAVVDAPKGKK